MRYALRKGERVICAGRERYRIVLGKYDVSSLDRGIKWQRDLFHDQVGDAVSSAIFELRQEALRRENGGGGGGGGGAETLFAPGRALHLQLDYTPLDALVQVLFLLVSRSKTHPLFYQEDRRGPLQAPSTSGRVFKTF